MIVVLYMETDNEKSFSFFFTNKFKNINVYYKCFIKSEEYFEVVNFNTDLNIYDLDYIICLNHIKMKTIPTILFKKGCLK